MKNRTWKTKLSFSVPMTFAALLNPALAHAEVDHGWSCFSANKGTFFNFVEPKLGRSNSSHVLVVGGFDGHYLHKEDLRDYRTYGEVSDTSFNVQILGPTTPSDFYEQSLIGYLQGTKDANGQWQVTFVPSQDQKLPPIPLSCSKEKLAE